MATAKSTSSSTTPTSSFPNPAAAFSDPAVVEARLGEIRELNEQLLSAAKDAGQASLDAYENALRSMLDFESKVAERSQLDWVSAIATAHADFVQSVTKSYLDAARQALK